MPVYTYECPKHGPFDLVARISDFERVVSCPECGAKSGNIIVRGHGGTWRNDPEWLKGVSRILPEVDGGRPFETVDDYRQYLKENPNVKPAESHPAIPSSAGDIKRMPTERERMVTMKKQAMDYLVKSEALEITSRRNA